MKILLDTNFLMDVVKFRIDLSDISALVLEPYKLATVSSVLSELDRISHRKSKSSAYAKLALRMVNDYNIEIIKSNKLPDEAIASLSKDKEFIAATNDIMLRKRLRALGRKTIYLKAKKHLAIG